MFHPRKHLGAARLILLAAAAGLMLTTQPAEAGKSCCPKSNAADGQTTAPKDNDKETTKPAATPAAGLRVHLDDQGRPTAPPEGKAAEATAPAAFSTSAAGLRQVPSAGPAGGIKVDLEGRFRTATVATTAPDGSIELNCVTGKE